MSDDVGIWLASLFLRLVERGGEKILQQQWHRWPAKVDGSKETEWRDVPVVKEGQDA